MGKSMKELIQDFQMKKGFFHPEERIVEQYKYSEENAYSNPEPDPNGDKEYIRKKKVDIADDLSKEDIDTVISLEQQKTLDEISKNIDDLKKLNDSLLTEQKQSNGHLRILKGVGIFFVILTLINVILAIVEAATLSDIISKISSTF